MNRFYGYQAIVIYLLISILYQVSLVGKIHLRHLLRAYNALLRLRDADNFCKIWWIRESISPWQCFCVCHLTWLDNQKRGAMRTEYGALTTAHMADRWTRLPFLGARESVWSSSEVAHDHHLKTAQCILTEMGSRDSRRMKKLLNDAFISWLVNSWRLKNVLTEILEWFYG